MLYDHTKHKARYVLVIILLILSWVVDAKGDSKAGQSKSILCAACHGSTGISPTSIWPNLAGQHATYLLQQLKQFRPDGKRASPVMSPMVIALSDQDMEDLAAYFSKQTKEKSVALEAKASPGERLYRQGDLSKHIPACASCHGPDGRGNEQAGFPMISHQHIDYTVQQLQAFQTDARTTDPMRIMRTISKKLSKEDMQHLAEYLAHL